MQGDPHVRFDEQGVETERLVSPTGELHATASPPDSTFLINREHQRTVRCRCREERARRLTRLAPIRDCKRGRAMLSPVAKRWRYLAEAPLD
jgi:hypothetical protein